MRPMGIGKKRTAYRDPAVYWLMKLSKAALADCVVDLLRGNSNSCDVPVGEVEALERLSAVLNMRGDKVPVPLAVKIYKRDYKAHSRKIFNEACRIAGMKGGE